MEPKTFETIKKAMGNVFSQASKGEVVFKTLDGLDWRYVLKFYANVNGRLYKNGENIFSNLQAPQKVLEQDFFVPTVQIPNLNNFVEKVAKYVESAKEFYKKEPSHFAFTPPAFVEKLIYSLIINASNFDLNNMDAYVERKIKEIETPYRLGFFKLGDMGELEVFASTSKLFSNLEGPLQFDTKFWQKESNFFELPSITYGIADKTAYVYAIQNHHTSQTGALPKKLDRFFRKVNKDVDMQSILGEVSPNALVALTIFLSAIKKEGIQKVLAPNFLPLRYDASISADKANIISAPNIEDFETTADKASNQAFEKVLEKRNKIQHNITNKFTYTLLRYCHHFDACQFGFDETKQQFQITLAPHSTKNDNIIHDIDNICSNRVHLTDKEKTIGI